MQKSFEDIGFLGFGKLGYAIADLAIQKKLFNKINICTRNSKISIKNFTMLQSDNKRIMDYPTLVKKSETIFILIKPQDIVNIHPVNITPRNYYSFMASIDSNLIKEKLKCDAVTRLLISSTETLYKNQAMAAIVNSQDNSIKEYLITCGVQDCLFINETEADLFSVITSLPAIISRNISSKNIYDILIDFIPNTGATLKNNLIKITEWILKNSVADSPSNSKIIAQMATYKGITHAIIASYQNTGSIKTAINAGLQQCVELRKFVKGNLQC